MSLDVWTTHILPDIPHIADDEGQGWTFTSWKASGLRLSLPTKAKQLMSSFQGCKSNNKSSSIEVIQPDKSDMHGSLPPYPKQTTEWFHARIWAAQHGTSE